MAKILAQKHLNSLRPVDDAGHDALRKIGNGEIVEIEFKRKRNVKFHRMFWALMSIVHENMEHDRYQVLCRACHKEKTGKADIPRIAKTKRISDREKGIRRPRTITRWRRFYGSVVEVGRQR